MNPRAIHELPFRSTLVLSLLLALSVGCGGQEQPDPGGPGGPGDPGGTSANQVALQAVIKTFLIPKQQSDFARDVDGDGVEDNKLGQIADAIDKAAPSMSWSTQLQQYTSDAINRGSYLALVQLLGATTALAPQPQARVRIDLGQDRDGDPTDNFSGSEELGLNPSSPGSSIGGAVDGAGALSAGPGDVMTPFVVGGGQLLMIPFKLTRVTGQVSPAGIVNGTLSGAVTKQDLDAKLLPAFAAYFTESLKTMTDAANKALVTQLFDPNKDGVISAAELKASIVGLALQPDVDTDGDKVKDAVSLGFGFSAVPCTIVP